jgi:hypothetical protein
VQELLEVWVCEDLRVLELSYVEGDATDPIGDGPRIIAHVCNDVGAWAEG